LIVLANQPFAGDAIMERRITDPTHRREQSPKSSKRQMIGPVFKRATIGESISFSFSKNVQDMSKNGTIDWCEDIGPQQTVTRTLCHSTLG
jgi:hypothetical protein